ncbi:adenosylcobinamide-GDP ribazoletransferase [Halonotius sp. F2-221B]|uniref:adenosylcobinamide-GDP ribazoletransferase n=1 Tax=Halonotius sp. F2-221B TaxID=2731620 RepID=UPI00398B2B23
MSESNPLLAAGRAIRGAVGFLTRIPVGGTEADWVAFCRRAYSLPVVGYLVGGLAGSVFFLPVQPPTLVAAYLVGLYLLTGVTHADGVADLGDTLAVHGDADRKRDVLKDSATGVGGTLLLAVTLFVVALGALSFAGIGPWRALRLVVAAEVGAKLGMVLVACYGRPAHEGLGSQLVGELTHRSLAPAIAVSLPAIAAAPNGLAPALVAAVATGPAVGVTVLTWGHRTLGGVSGDLLGATNEIGRALALHVGVSVWILT